MENETIKTQTEQRDELVQQAAFLNRRISELDGQVKERVAHLDSLKEEIIAANVIKSQLLMSELPTLRALIADIKNSVRNA